MRAPQPFSCTQRNGGSATLYGAGQRCPAPLPLPPHPKGGASHTPTSPRQSVSKQASKPGQGGGGTTLPHHPTKAPTPKHANTPSEHAPRVNTKPSHPQANTPTTSLLFHHPREHKKRPHSSVWAQPSVSATGEPWKSRRPARTKRRHTTRARRQRTHKKRKQPGLRRVPPAPAREDSAREGRSQ